MVGAGAVYLVWGHKTQNAPALSAGALVDI
jgi:hypothetical protein